MINLLRLGGVGAALVLSFGVGFALKDLQSGGVPDVSAFQALLSGGKRPNPTPTEVFRDHFGQIQAKFYRTVDKSRLKYAAMEGMFQALGDPHTNYLEPVTAEGFATETRGNFVGIGARLSPDPLGAKIVRVFKDSPAERAGIKEGDTILQVGGKDTSGIPVDDIVTLIRGEEGTTVDITVLRQGERITVRARRAKVSLPTAEGKMLGKTGVGYISVSGFSETTPAQFDEALRELMEQNATALVLDLRSNPGGLLESATEMLSRFESNKVVVTMRGRNSRVEEKRTTADAVTPFKGRVVILMNEESASAAEIFAGVMREYGRASLVGEHSYGKASVQDVVPLIDNASAKITIARYYLPSGKDISRRVDEEGQYVSGGLKPDVEAALKIEPGTTIGEPGKDSQLDRAIQIALGKS